MTDADRLALLETSLHQRITTASAAAKYPLQADDITKIVTQVIASLSGDVSGTDLKFYAELEELASYIRHAKEEIAAIRPKEISANHIPQATNELDAVVGATEDATNKIMDVCDIITVLAGECAPEVNEKLMNCTTRIYEACNFQDLTGQRITKVVQTLKYIDDKIEALLKALGDEIGHSDLVPTKEPSKPDSEKALLNGPQSADKAIDQAAIDKLLSE